MPFELPNSELARPESSHDSQHRSKERDRRILHEQVDSLLSTSASVFIAGLLLAIAFAGLFYWKTQQPGILIWLGLLNCWQIYRFTASLRYAKIPSAQREPEKAARGYCYGNAVTSTFWGLVPWLFFPHGDIALTAIMVLVLMGIASGGIGSVSSYRYTVYCLIIPILSGLATALLWQGDVVNVFLGLCALAYMALNLQLGLEQHRLLDESLRTRYEKEDIAQRLAEQVRIVERASLEKTRFFASASHDLRQPLHSLGLFGSTILSKLKGTPDELLGRNLMHCVDALETSFSAMLDVSKLDAGVVEVNSSAVALGDVFRLLQTNFGRQAEEKGLSLRFRPGNKWVLADAALLERLLGNLVHNALKFTSQGGVTVLARTRGNHASVEVWDTGSGMNAQELPRIFDEFYQLGNQERDRSMGLGMGLAIVRRLSKLMGMALVVKSQPGRGTAFKITMPLITAPIVKPAPVRSTGNTSHDGMAGIRVLIVDDEENVRASTAIALRSYGMQVEVADGMQQACDIACRLESEKLGLDALITDFRLRNNEDGITLVNDIRILIGRKIPAILVTGDTAPERVRRAQESGLRVLYKPVKIQHFVDEIRVQISTQTESSAG